MTLDSALLARAGNQCELCSSDVNLTAWDVMPSDGSMDQQIVVCEQCRTQLDDPAATQVNHWRCLNDSMWSQTPAVQVVAWRQLHYLSSLGEIWAQDLQDMLYLDDATRQWAEAGLADDDHPPTLDSNGTPLQAGDSVTLIKDLDVKGAGFTAKRGTLVKNISLSDNPEHIEGRVNGTRIVLVSKFLKKA